MKKTILITTLLLCYNISIYASDFNIPNVFIANQPAIASEVNGNFGAAKTAIDNNHDRVAALEATVTSLQNTINSLNSRLTAVENNTVLELDGLLQFSMFKGYPTAEFTDVNVQINNGSDSTTGAINGLGNLTIGYNESQGWAINFCSDPQYIDSVNCIGNLELWGRWVYRGSHNLIMGRANSYDDSAGIVMGRGNVINGDYASVLGGTSNIASGEFSFIGTGSGNTATGERSSIVGGASNTASGSNANVSGGFLNQANGATASVTGGENNTANGTRSVVSGGNTRTASNQWDWVAGSLFEDL